MVEIESEFKLFEQITMVLSAKLKDNYIKLNNK